MAEVVVTVLAGAGAGIAEPESEPTPHPAPSRMAPTSSEEVRSFIVPEPRDVREPSGIYRRMKQIVHRRLRD